MEFLPKVKAAKFEDINSGDLFFFESKGMSSIGLKAVDRKADGDQFIVPFGPAFPSGHSPAQLIAQRGLIVASIGKEYLIRTPSTPDGWSARPPPAQILAFAVLEDELYVRANCSPRHDDFQPCFVKMVDGSLSHGRGDATVVYALTWELVVPDYKIAVRTILKSNFSS